MSYTDLLAAYLYNRRCYLERDLQQLRDNMRYRPVSSEDCYKYIIACERLKMFSEVSRDIRQLMRFKGGIPPPKSLKTNENAPKINFNR